MVFGRGNEVSSVGIQRNKLSKTGGNEEEEVEEGSWRLRSLPPSWLCFVAFTIVLASWLCPAYGL